MGDRTGDSFRGWVYALGLCGGGWGALGVCCGLRFSTCSLAGWGVGLSGCSGEGECVLWGCVSVRKEAFQGFISPT